MAEHSSLGKVNKMFAQNTYQAVTSGSNDFVCLFRTPIGLGEHWGSA